jgi:hypothetical protein
MAPTLRDKIRSGGTVIAVAIMAAASTIKYGKGPTALRLVAHDQLTGGLVVLELAELAQT